jgi:hypothetical protein
MPQTLDILSSPLTSYLAAHLYMSASSNDSFSSIGTTHWGYVDLVYIKQSINHVQFATRVAPPWQQIALASKGMYNHLLSKLGAICMC